MLYAIRALSVLLCVTLVGDGHLQHFTSPCQSHLIVPVQIFIAVRVVLAIYILKKTLAVAQISHPILKLDPEPLVIARESKEDIERRLRTVYQRTDWLQTELSALQDVHAWKVASLTSALAKARTLRFRSLGRKIHKGHCIKCSVKCRSLQTLRRVKKTSQLSVAALLSRNEELEKRAYHLRIGVHKFASGALGQSGRSHALDQFAFPKVNFEDTATLMHPVDTSNPGPRPPSEATSLASLPHANAESESQISLKGQYSTLSLDQTTEDNDDRSESGDRSLDEAPTPTILSLGVFEELTNISSLAALYKGRSGPGDLLPLSEVSDGALFCVAKTANCCANVCLTDAMKDPFSNVFTNDGMKTGNIVTSLGVPHQSFKPTLSSLSYGFNALTPVGCENPTLQPGKLWDMDYTTDTMGLRREGETSSSVILPESPLDGAAASSEADTTSFVYSPSALGLDSLCDSNLSSMLSHYFKEESLISVPRAERPPESHLYEESRLNLFPSGTDINTTDMMCLSSQRPIMLPYSSVSTMIGLGIKSLQPIGGKGDKPFASLPSAYTSKSPKSRTLATASKGAHKATSKVPDNRKVLANLENCEIEYIE